MWKAVCPPTMWLPEIELRQFYPLSHLIGLELKILKPICHLFKFLRYMVSQDITDKLLATVIVNINIHNSTCMGVLT